VRAARSSVPQIDGRARAAANENCKMADIQTRPLRLAPTRRRPRRVCRASSQTRRDHQHGGIDDASCASDKQRIRCDVSSVTVTGRSGECRGASGICCSGGQADGWGSKTRDRRRRTHQLHTHLGSGECFSGKIKKR